MTLRFYRAVAITCAGLSLAACVGAPVISNTTLSAVEGLKDGKSGRARVKEKRDVAAINQVRKVYLGPVKLATGENTRYVLTDQERAVVVNEVEAQLCFELSERFEVSFTKDDSDAHVNSAVTWFEPTGAAASGAAALAGQFIPGPVGVRLPGSLGGLGAEAEMLKGETQIAAIVWARRAQAIGTDTPSLSRLGDALQFAEPFGDEAARVMSPEPLPTKRTYTKATDPCAKYGDRIDGGGIAARMITGLYSPTRRNDDKGEAKKTENPK